MLTLNDCARDHRLQMEAFARMFGGNKVMPLFDGQDPTESYDDLSDAEINELQLGEVAPDTFSLLEDPDWEH